VLGATYGSGVVSLVGVADSHVGSPSDLLGQSSRVSGPIPSSSSQAKRMAIEEVRTLRDRVPVVTRVDRGQHTVQPELQQSDCEKADSGVSSGRANCLLCSHLRYPKPRLLRGFI
jgi:hypothetical protein